MISDYIKQIVFKFKAEGAQDVMKASDSLVNNLNPKKIEETLKKIPQLQREIGKAGSGMTDGITRFGKVLKEINDTQIKGFKVNFEQSLKSVQDIEKHLQRLDAMGASDKVKNAYKAKYVNSMNTAMDAANKIPLSPQQAMLGQIFGPGAAGMTGSMGSSMLGVAAIAKALQAYGSIRQTQYEWTAQREQDRATSYSAISRNRNDVYSGALERAVLARSGGLEYANERAKTQADRKIDGERYKGIGQAILGGAMMVGGGALAVGAGWTGIGAVAGVGLMAAGAGMAGVGGTNAAKTFQAEHKQAIRQTEQDAAEADAKSMSLNVNLYNRFREKAGMRYQYQTQLGLDDNTAFGYTQGASSVGMKEAEFANTAMSFRSLGSGNAAGLALSAGTMAREQGTSDEHAAQQLHTMAMLGTGGQTFGPGGATDKMAQLFQMAVAGGIADSGLADAFKDTVTSMMQAQGGKSDPVKMGEALLSTQVGPMDAFSIQQGAKGLDVAGKFTGQGGMGIRGQVAFENAMSATGNDLYKANLLQNLTEAEIQAGGNDMTKAAGISPETVKQMGKQNFNSTLKLGAKGGITDKYVTSIKDKIEKGETVSINDVVSAGGAMTTAAGGVPKSSQEAAATFLSQMNLNRGKDQKIKITGTDGKLMDIPLEKFQDSSPEEQQKMLAAVTGKNQDIVKNSAAGQQRSAEVKGEDQLNKDIQAQIVPQMKDFMVVFQKEMLKAVQDAPKEGYAEAFEGIETSANHLSEALEIIAKRLKDNADAFGSAKH